MIKEEKILTEKLKSLSVLWICMGSVKCHMHYKRGEITPNKIDVNCSINPDCYENVDKELLSQMFAVAGRNLTCPGRERCLLVSSEDYTRMDPNPHFWMQRLRTYDLKPLPE